MMTDEELNEIHADRVTELEAENERLREALERIAFGFDGDEFQDPADALDEHVNIARAALAAAGDTGAAPTKEEA